MVPRLVEREEAGAAVEEQLARARARRSGVLLLVGEAGVGKSSLLAEAVEAAVPSVDVALARCASMDAGIPWGLVEQLLRQLGDRSTPNRPVPALERSAPYLHALEQVRRAGARPLLIALDDLHWADPDSLDVIAFLARRIEDLPVTVIATLRPWPRAAHDAARALVHGGHAREVQLRPLSPEGSRLLLARRSAVPLDEREHARAWELCRGNPLLIEQLAAAPGRTGAQVAARARTGGDDARAGAQVAARARTGGDDAHLAAPRAHERPDATGVLLVERFAGLDEQSLAFARCASVMGTRFWTEVAGTLALLDAPAVERALEALHRAGLVADDGERLRFAHPLFAQALYDELPPPLRRRLHGRACACLERLGRLEEAAEHAVRGAAAGDARAAALLERVGRTALRDGAVVAAEGRLAAAARLLGDHAGPRLLLALAEAQCARGDVAAATATCERVSVAPAASWEERLDGFVLLGRCRYLAGDADLGETALERAVAIAERHDPARAVVPLLDQTTSAWMAAGPGRALPLAVRARALASDAAPELREEADAVWGHLLAECGDPRGIAATEPIGRLLRDRSASAAAALRPAELLSPRASIYPFAHCALYAERFDDAAAALALARERIEGAGAANALAVVSLFSANHLIRRGRLSDALAEVDRAERFAELTPVASPHAALLRAQVLLWLGRREESAAEARRGAADGEGIWMVALSVAHVDGLDRLWDGDRRASDAFLEVERIAAAAGIGEPGHTQWGGHGAAAHLLAGRVDDARRVVGALELSAARHPSRWPRFAALLGRARIAEHAGDLDGALGACRDALEALGEVDLPLQRIEAQVVLGRLLRRTGQSRAARPHLAEAARAAEACGAAPLLDAARAELRLAGGRRRPERARGRLTPGELRVAFAAADGRSNAEIASSLHLSVHTVESHLKHVYAKLGIAGRRALRPSQLAAEQGVDDG